VHLLRMRPSTLAPQGIQIDGNPVTCDYQPSTVS
jgi:hypothetical protein